MTYIKRSVDNYERLVANLPSVFCQKDSKWEYIDDRFNIDEPHYDSSEGIYCVYPEDFTDKRFGKELFYKFPDWDSLFKLSLFLSQLRDYTFFNSGNQITTY